MNDGRLPADAAGEDLAALYKTARVRLEVVVRQAVERGAGGTAAYYRGQLSEVQEILARLAERSADASARAARDPYGRTARAVDGTLARPVAYAFRFGGVHEQAVQILAENLHGRLGDARATVGRRVEDAFRRAQLREAAVGIVEGTTRREVSEALRDRIVREAITDATTGFVDRAGRRWSLDSYAEMVARTTTREAQSAATANRLADHDLDLIDISTHNTTTPVCLPYEGGTFSLTGDDPDHDRIEVLPPFHPGCQHVATPSGVSFDAWEAALRAAA